MPISPFHAYYKTRTLTNLSRGQDKLLPVFASSDIEIFPYQVAAANFAMRSQYLKGCILCDDGSLGKSFEAMLIVTQKWYEGKDRILIIVPTPLLRQWCRIIDDRFPVPLCPIDRNAVFDRELLEGNENPFLQEGVVITTYDFAVEKAEYISKIKWNLSVFDEAHHLRRIYTSENKSANIIRAAVGDSFKLLLTATPMQNSIMDLYGLVYFIDETALPEATQFYKRYFRKSENYAELSNRVSRFCFRTLRTQVDTYVKIPERIPATIEFTPDGKEERLAGMLSDYLAREKKYAFPKMELYDLTLMLYRSLSSSTFAFAKTLEGIEVRLSQMLADEPQVADELTQVREMLSLARSIKVNAKGEALVEALKKGFTSLKQSDGNKKALIFTENRTTQRYLYDLLNTGWLKGKVLEYNGGTSRDYEIIDRFEKDAAILIATDVAAEGFDFEFCSFVVNYDMSYNTLKMEQRICRCHRQGQQKDVVVVNLLNPNNFADVRMLELVNKRILQFDGIMGMSETLLGNFGESEQFGRILATVRTKEEIDREFDRVLSEHETINKHLVKTAEQSLFTYYNRKIAESVTVSPQYFEQRMKAINADLWEVTKYFFDGKPDYKCDDDTRTVCIGIQPQKVFTGGHIGRREYSIDDRTLPRSGRHTVVGPLARNIFGEIFWRGIPDRGTIRVSASNDLLPCTIGYYRVKVKRKGDFFSAWEYNAFAGRTAEGRILSHDECVSIMELPVAGFTSEGDTYGQQDGATKPKPRNPMDELISRPLLTF